LNVSVRPSDDTVKDSHRTGSGPLQHGGVGGPGGGGGWGGGASRGGPGGFGWGSPGAIEAPFVGAPSARLLWAVVVDGGAGSPVVVVGSPVVVVGSAVVDVVDADWARSAVRRGVP